MESEDRDREEKALRATLEKDLLELYGPLLNGPQLTKILGYSSKDAFRQAVTRRLVAVPLFELDHRRGKFALARDVAAYLARKRRQSNYQQRGR